MADRGRVLLGGTVALTVLLGAACLLALRTFERVSSQVESRGLRFALMVETAVDPLDVREWLSSAVKGDDESMTRRTLALEEDLRFVLNGLHDLDYIRLEGATESESIVRVEVGDPSAPKSVSGFTSLLRPLTLGTEHQMNESVEGVNAWIEVRLNGDRALAMARRELMLPFVSLLCVVGFLSIGFACLLWPRQTSLSRWVSARARVLAPAATLFTGCLITFAFYDAEEQSESRMRLDTFRSLVGDKIYHELSLFRAIEVKDFGVLRAFFESSETVTVEELSHFGTEMAQDTAISFWAWLPSAIRPPDTGAEPENRIACHDDWMLLAQSQSPGEAKYSQRAAPAMIDYRKLCRDADRSFVVSPDLLPGVADPDDLIVGICVTDPQCAACGTGVFLLGLEKELVFNAGVAGSIEEMARARLTREGDAPSATALPGKGSRDDFAWDIPFVAHGTRFQLEVVSSPAFAAMFPRQRHQASLGLGFVVSALCAGIVYLTGRRRSELEKEVALQTSELRKLIGVVEQSPFSIAITDLNGAIEYVNERFCEMTGYTPEEVMGRNTSILKSDRMDPAVYADIWQTLGRGEIWTGEILNRHKDGTLGWVRSVIAPVRNSEGKTLHYVAFKEDINELKRIRDDLLHARDEARAASEAKSLFLTNMSHEMRTPMNGILGMLELLLDERNLQMPQRDRVRTIHSCARTLLALIDHLIDLSNLDGDRLELKRERFNLHRAVGDVAHTFKVEAEQKGLRFHLSWDPAIPSLVMGDIARTVQVLTNLLGNAVKFTDSGEISFRARLIPGEKGPAHMVGFEIEDTGTGIEREKLEAIFQRFAQADLSLSRRFSGAGLGLSVAAGLLQLMGGDILVESELGKGSIFRLKIPFEPAETNYGQTPTPGEPAEGPSRSLDVLLVEDNLVNQMVTRHMLENLGHRVTIASDGNEALSALDSHVFDVVLMDVQMPGMDGLEATRRIRNSEAYEHVSKLPIIALTAHARNEDRRQCAAAGMDAFLSKPVSLKALSQALVRVQDGVGVES